MAQTYFRDLFDDFDNAKGDLKTFLTTFESLVKDDSPTCSVKICFLFDSSICESILAIRKKINRKETTTGNTSPTQIPSKYVPESLEQPLSVLNGTTYQWLLSPRKFIDNYKNKARQIFDTTKTKTKLEIKNKTYYTRWTKPLTIKLKPHPMDIVMDDLEEKLRIGTKKLNDVEYNGKMQQYILYQAIVKLSQLKPIYKDDHFLFVSYTSSNMEKKNKFIQEAKTFVQKYPFGS